MKPKRRRTIGQGDNPFEMKKNRPKFAVLGKKVKGTTVKTARSNAASHEKRKETIGAEFERRGKVGDRRGRAFSSSFFFCRSLTPGCRRGPLWTSDLARRKA